MKRNAFVILVCASLGMAASTAYAGGPPSQPAPTQGEIQQQAMQNGPSTMQSGYLTQKDPVGPHRKAGPVDPRLLQPLTKREVGMLFNACIGYAECATSYSRAYEHNQALQRAQKEKVAANQGN
ncbi:MAG: hypothetical protein ABI132_02090 [Rhodanobacteraceae bacterium]